MIVSSTSTRDMIMSGWMPDTDGQWIDTHYGNYDNEVFGAALCARSMVSNQRFVVLKLSHKNMITRFNPKTGEEETYGIRKLTPRECFRLQGVKEYMIDRLQTKRVNNKGKEEYVVSKSQQYKQAGNSICVDCLTNLFSRMFIFTDDKPKQGTQMSMFDMDGFM